jgi:hypothetical protein
MNRDKTIKAGMRYANPIIYKHDPTVVKPALRLLQQNKWVTHHEIYMATGENVSMVIAKLKLQGHKFICINENKGVKNIRYSLRMGPSGPAAIPIEIDDCGEISTVNRREFDDKQ